jgi:hypothetical protein
MSGKCIRLFVIVFVILISSCGTKRVTPITGRTYRVAEGKFSDEQMLQFSQRYYGEIISDLGGESHDTQKNQW